MDRRNGAPSGANITADLALLDAVIAEHSRRSKPKKVTLAGIVSALRGLGEGTRVEVKIDGGHSSHYGHSLFIWRDHNDRTRYEMLDVGGGGGSAAAQRRHAATSAPNDDDAHPPPAFPLEPSLKVNTSPGKFQFWWLVEGCLTVGDFGAIMQTMIDRYRSDPNAKDQARLLRLPGTFHNKGEPFEVTWDYGATVEIEVDGKIQQTKVS